MVKNWSVIATIMPVFTLYNSSIKAIWTNKVQMDKWISYSRDRLPSGGFCIGGLRQYIW